ACPGVSANLAGSGGRRTFPPRAVPFGRRTLPGNCSRRAVFRAYGTAVGPVRRRLPFGPGFRLRIRGKRIGRGAERAIEISAAPHRMGRGPAAEPGSRRPAGGGRRRRTRRHPARRRTRSRPEGGDAAPGGRSVPRTGACGAAGGGKTLRVSGGNRHWDTIANAFSS